MKHILIIEDEESIRGFIEINLMRYGYAVLQAGSAEEGIDLVKKAHHPIDIVLLDVMLPGMNGFEACKEIRNWNPSIGIIMLTAKVQEMDKVHGLMNGADDYIPKPFSPNELIARIEALLRRMNVHRVKEDNQSPITLNEQKRLLFVQGKKIDLSPIEYELLSIIFKANGEAISRNDLLDEVWGLQYAGDPKIVDVNIRRIRQKIEKDPSLPHYILTVWGYGYRWNDENGN
ncbi:response regulator transcription factor [Rossellomorea aquimaris]|jgi:DNA-binding response OmpR family regulator|uniref:Response regulator transcription factor n=1 Tax=Rossellomorea aquimaris TaxID=189382 RepID=A0A5D4TPQ8_9BACI|nr:response regulator transcription factor [Rossellomorea aquimaris]TYS76808.1 response regulator transcription factor [Rossellomorea aquimaris]TYS83713.1 response regulator transcription factor [Rossellomorea aquimaris]